MRAVRAEGQTPLPPAPPLLSSPGPLAAQQVQEYKRVDLPQRSAVHPQGFGARLRRCVAHRLLLIRVAREVRGQLHGRPHRQRAAAQQAYFRHWGPRGGFAASRVRRPAPRLGSRTAHAPSPPPPRRTGPRVRDRGLIEAFYRPGSGPVRRSPAARGGPRGRGPNSLAPPAYTCAPPSHVDEWVEPLQRLCLQARDEEGVVGSVGTDTSGAPVSPLPSRPSPQLWPHLTFSSIALHP